jgi:predicted Zn-dependent protease
MNENALFDRAVSLKDNGDLPGARQVLEQLVSAKPESAGYHSYLGYLCWEEGLLDQAVTAFHRATELNPESETASLGLFHSLWEMGQKEEALEEMKRYLQIADCEDYRNILAEINAIPE